MSFEQFENDPLAIQLLQRSLDSGRLAHAYLFIGSTLADLEAAGRTLAKTINCQQPPRRGASGFPLDCCDRCANCRRTDEDNHPDIQWVRPESKSRIITIDQIRQLMQVIYLKPTEAEYKIAMIVAADRLTVPAANAFLKTLEEPPSKSILILLSTEPERVLETIISRCIRLSFPGEGRSLFQSAETGWLAEFSAMAARQEKTLLGRYRLLSVLLNRLNQMKGEIDAALTARSPLERHDEIEPRLREKWEEELTAAIEAEYRRQRSDILLGLQWWLRDVWLHASSVGQQLLAFPRLAPSAQSVADRISAEDAAENLRVLDQIQRLLGTNVQEALALEVGLLRLKL